MKKILIIASVLAHINAFHLPYIDLLKNNGFKVDVAGAGIDDVINADCIYRIPIERSPYKINNIIAYKKLKKIIDENDYIAVHCHTPMGGVISRLAAISKRKKGLKMIYTVHGFHFYKGASIKNWILYYPIEKFLSQYTDCLITINTEDYELANSKRFKAKVIKLVNGVGIENKKFIHVEKNIKESLRNSYGYSDDDFIIISVGELNSNKNHTQLIDAVVILKNYIPTIKVIIVGKGEYNDLYKSRIKSLGVEKSIKLLGYRNDVDKLMSVSDVLVSTSKREGLPVNVMEAMSTGLPVVATNCRGNRDLIKNLINGIIVEVGDAEELAIALKLFFENEELTDKIAMQNLKDSKKYSLNCVVDEMERIYSEIIEYRN